MIRGRRAARQHNYIRPLIIGFSIAGILLLIITTANITSRPTTHAATPQPTATWTTYIPTTPQICRDAMDAADDAIIAADERYDATIKAASQPNSITGLRQKEKLLNDAKKAHAEWTKTVLQKYTKLSKGCRK